jgi:hypothetical protein
MADRSDLPLIDAVCELSARYDNVVGEKERLILKMAICLLDQIDKPAWESHPRRVEFTFEEYEKAPGRWELMDGQLSDY